MTLTPIDPKEAQKRQLALITNKALLGDDRTQELLENHGTSVAQTHAKMAARNNGLCDCARTDGIICGRPLTPRAGHLCWPCWGRQQDRKPCDHDLGRYVTPEVQDA